MDGTEDENYNNKCHFLKRIVQFFVTISVFSLFLCFSSGFSLFPNSSYLYFNTCLFSFLTRTLERKYMFLICNGILAFLAKSSSVSCSSPSSLSDQNFHLLPMKSTISLVAQEEEEEEANDKKEEKTLSKEKAESEDLVAENGSNEEESERVLVAENEGNQEERERVLLVKQDQEEEEENEELVSTEELNRRIEEFIRKMKEEIRIEAQRPLIAV